MRRDWAVERVARVTKPVHAHARKNDGFVLQLKQTDERDALLRLVRLAVIGRNKNYNIFILYGY